VVDSSLVDTPTVIGWVKPVILLPVAAFAGLSPSQVEAILAHELAHIRRHDFLVNLLQTFAETILFYHPAVWWLSARIRAEREHCCDVVALSVCGDAVSYAEALVELESRRTVHSRLAMAATGGSLMTRVRRLLGVPADDRPRAFGSLAIAALIVLIVCVAGASRYLVAAQANHAVQPGTADDPAPWSMVFNQADSTMRFIGYRGRDLIRFAYQVPQARVVGGPRWLDEQVLHMR
jgi:beta-lactamase regulating signal transducer with metallopeptidase domain